MPNDYIHLKVLIRELDTFLKGGKIEKIAQPQKDEVILSVRNNSQNYSLLISCDPEIPRIHLTRQKKENPLTAFSFCMLLRKYLEKSTVLSAELLNNDRIIAIKFRAKNELLDVNTYTLILELMSRYSNIILVGESASILGAAKQTFLNESADRIILPGSLYSYPPNTKINAEDIAAVYALLTDGRESGLEAAFAVNTLVGGLAKETVKELFLRSKLSGAESLPLNALQAEAFTDELSSISNPVKISPCTAKKSDRLSDFFISPFASCNADYDAYKYLNDAADELYTAKEKDAVLSKKSKALNGILKKALTKTEKKIADNKDNLLKCENAENIKKAGNMILNNIYTIKKNQSVLSAIDYESGETTQTAIDPKLSPSENAAVYFKRYSKLKRTEENANKNLSQNTLFLEYLTSIAQSIELADSTVCLSEIEAELTDAGLLRAKPVKNKKGKNKKANNAPSKPYECVVDGFKIYAGRNNIQNDFVTFSLAKNGDIWLHTKNYHGSHVVVAAEGSRVSDKALLAAASLAAYFSKARTSSKVPVDYTEKRNVKKIPDSGKGMVTYSNFKTIVADPELQG
jgi:predicted ribosome quality control (RQC) complex YloA/Tae2 family protein